jgi:hypothetical protein
MKRREERIGRRGVGAQAERDAWLRLEGASDTELEKPTLTNLYNERTGWLAIAHPSGTRRCSPRMGGRRN